MPGLITRFLPALILIMMTMISVSKASPVNFRRRIYDDFGASTSTPPTPPAADTTAPAFASMSVPADGYRVNPATLDFTVTWNENIVVTGTPRLLLTIGSTFRHATFTGASGATASFSYALAVSDLDNDGIVVSPIVQLNGGTIRDAAGNDASTTLTVPDTSRIRVGVPVPTGMITAATDPGANNVAGGGDDRNIIVWFVDWNGGGDGSAATLPTSLTAAQAASGFGDVFVLVRDNGAADDRILTSSGVTMSRRQQIVGGGSTGTNSVTIGLENLTVGLSGLGQNGEIRRNSYSGNVITVDDNAILKGIRVTGGTYGIRGNAKSNIVIDNVTVRDNRGGGAQTVPIYLSLMNGNVSVTNSCIFDNFRVGAGAWDEGTITLSDEALYVTFDEYANNITGNFNNNSIYGFVDMRIENPSVAGRTAVVNIQNNHRIEVPLTTNRRVISLNAQGTSGLFANATFNVTDNGNNGTDICGSHSTKPGGINGSNVDLSYATRMNLVYNFNNNRIDVTEGIGSSQGTIQGTGTSNGEGTVRYNIDGNVVISDTVTDRLFYFLNAPDGGADINLTNNSIDFTGTSCSSVSGSSVTYFDNNSPDSYYMRVTATGNYIGAGESNYLRIGGSANATKLCINFAGNSIPRTMKSGVECTSRYYYTNGTASAVSVDGLIPGSGSNPYKLNPLDGSHGLTLVGSCPAPF